MGKPKDITDKAKDYLDAHTQTASANHQLQASQRLYDASRTALEKAIDALQDCVGDNVRRRAIHIDGNTVLVEYDPNTDKGAVSVLNEEGEVRI